MLPIPGPVPLYQHDRPDSVQLIISRVLVTNNHWTRCSNAASIEAHKVLLASHQDLSLHKPDFPGSTTDVELITDDHKLYSSSDTVSFLFYEGVEFPLPEVVCIDLEQFWMEFTGVKNAGTRPVSFIESFPISLWMSIPPPASAAPAVNRTGEKESSSPTMGIMIDIGAKICAQINHYQFCFLMRLADTLTDLGDTIANEAKLHEDEFTQKILEPVSRSTGNCDRHRHSAL